MKNKKSPLRILLADDDEGDRLVFQEIFEEMDSDVSVHIGERWSAIVRFPQ